MKIRLNVTASILFSLYLALPIARADHFGGKADASARPSVGETKRLRPIATDPSSGKKVEQMRITSRTQLKRLEDICEVSGQLFLYTDDVRLIVLPRLQKVGALVIESENLEGINLPHLTEAGSVSVLAPGLKILELPELKNVQTRLDLRDLRMQFLNLAQLETAGEIRIENCRNLEFIFADKLQKAQRVGLQGLPRLSVESEENILAVARYRSPKELAFRVQQQKALNDFKAQVFNNRGINGKIRSTGHPTQYDSFGTMARYGKNAPQAFQEYSESFDPFEFRLVYNASQMQFMWILDYPDFRY